MERAIYTVLLLLASNTFMTYAWYYHLKKPGWGLVTAILASWGIALFEYVLQVPANRIGHVGHGGPMTLAQLKITQEAITLVVFTVFAIVVMQQKLRVNDLIAMGLIFAAVVVSYMGRK